MCGKSVESASVESVDFRFESVDCVNPLNPLTLNPLTVCVNRLKMQILKLQFGSNGFLSFETDEISPSVSKHLLAGFGFACLTLIALKALNIWIPREQTQTQTQTQEDPLED